jgi:hypothetical protein
VTRSGRRGKGSAKGKRGKMQGAATAAAPQMEGDAAADNGMAADSGDQISYSNLSLHDLFEQQARNMLENADIDEEQKQSILVGLACPCCGAGGMSFSVKLKRP